MQSFVMWFFDHGSPLDLLQSDILPWLAPVQFCDCIRRPVQGFRLSVVLINGYSNVVNILFPLVYFHDWKEVFSIEDRKRWVGCVGSLGKFAVCKHFYRAFIGLFKQRYACEQTSLQMKFSLAIRWATSATELSDWLSFMQLSGVTFLISSARILVFACRLLWVVQKWY